MANKPTNKNPKSIESLRHTESTRKHIPTAEYQSLLVEDQQTPIQVAYNRRNPDLDPQLVWRGKDLMDWSDLVVTAPTIYIQEKVHPKVLVDDLRLQTEEIEKSTGPYQIDLFADFNGLPNEAAKTEFYQHEANWSNRLILGDSLQVMASLAEREGLRGQVQCIYIDPPYGIKFNSNFQWSTTSKNNTDGKADHITREPEQVKAFRDTWNDGIHSYLTYLRDRLIIARDLLSVSGSIFVQIGDENVHLVRSLMDEVFGNENFIAMIFFQTAANQNTNRIQRLYDILLWYKGEGNLKYRELFREREQYEINNVFTANDDTTGLPYKPSQIKSDDQKDRIIKAGRITSSHSYYKRFLTDFPYVRYDNVWKGTVESTFSKEKIYVVQTNRSVIERCILMTTDPGDLVLDPTCGSGSSSYVSEQWGRRWITIDTSRVALALARSRIMGAKFPYYLLLDSKEGVLKDAEIRKRAPSQEATYGNIRRGFVYEKIPHITLSTIVSNTEIDLIYENYKESMDNLRSKLNKYVNKNWEDWEVPKEINIKWSDEVKKIHNKWWQLRLSRQNEIEESITSKADFELLYNKPFEDNKKVRVAGPFTVESLSPHRILGVDENDELIDQVAEGKAGYAPGQSFEQMILENLKLAGVQQAHKEDKINFFSLTPWPGYYICAEGRYFEGDKEKGKEKRAGIFIGPEFGTVSRPDLVAAAREAGDAGFDVLIACAFNYDAQSTEFSKLGAIPVLKARMNADLHMAGDLKKTSKGNLFVIFGEPDIELIEHGNNQVKVKIKGVDVFHPGTGEVRSDNTDGIACWFIDTDYNEEAFFVRHAYFLGANDPYSALKTTLRAEINEEAWDSLNSDTSRPFDKPKSGRIAVKVINHLGDEVMKVFRVR